MGIDKIKQCLRHLSVFQKIDSVVPSAAIMLVKTQAGICHEVFQGLHGHFMRVSGKFGNRQNPVSNVNAHRYENILFCSLIVIPLSQVPPVSARCLRCAR